MCSSSDNVLSINSRGRVQISALLITLLLFMFESSVYAFLTDKDIHPPPSDGTYQYSPSGSALTCTFCKGAGVPGSGGSYVDPVFGETIKTITNHWPYSSQYPQEQLMYSNQLLISKNNTYIAAQDIYTNIIFHYVSDGSVYWDNNVTHQVGSQDAGFDPSDDDTFYFYAGSSLKKATLSTKTVSTIHTFSGSVNNGGSARIVDNSGRYFVAAVGSTAYAYDRVANVVYPGVSVGRIDEIAMAPNASGFLLTYNSNWIRWYPLNNTDHTVGSPVTVVNLASIGMPGAHSTLLTDSDGVTWYINQRADYPNFCNGINKVQVTNPSNIVCLISSSYLGNNVSDAYFSANATSGSARDWFVMSNMSSYDSTWSAYHSATPWNNWFAMREEIFMVNVKTGELRRLAHHRSRGWDLDYYFYPKVNLSTDGSLVAFTSNMGRAADPITGSTTLNGYCDIYTVTTGLNNAPAPAAPKNLRIVP